MNGSHGSRFILRSLPGYESATDLAPSIGLPAFSTTSAYLRRCDSWIIPVYFCNMEADRQGSGGLPAVEEHPPALHERTWNSLQGVQLRAARL